METKHFWEGAIGMSISTRTNRKTNEPFYTFELVRCFTREGSGEMAYANDFTLKHVPAIEKVMERGLAFMHENPLTPDVTQVFVQRR